MEKKKDGNGNGHRISNNGRISDRRREDSSNRRVDHKSKTHRVNVEAKIRAQAPGAPPVPAERFRFKSGPPPRHPWMSDSDYHRPTFLGGHAQNRPPPPSCHKARVKVKGPPEGIKIKLRNLLRKNYKKGLEIEHIALTFMRAYHEALDPLAYGFRTMEKLLRSDEFNHYVDVRKRPNTEIVMVKGKDVVGPPIKKSRIPIALAAPAPAAPEPREKKEKIKLAAVDEKKDASEVTGTGTTRVFDYGHGKEDNPKEYVVTACAEGETGTCATPTASTIWNMCDRRPEPGATIASVCNFVLLERMMADSAGIFSNSNLATQPLALTFGQNASQNTFLMGPVNTGFKPITQEAVVVTKEPLVANPNPTAAIKDGESGAKKSGDVHRDSSSRSRSHRRSEKKPRQIKSFEFKKRTKGKDMPSCSRAVRKAAFELAAAQKLKSMSKSKIDEGIRQINPFVLHMNGLPNDIPWEKIQRLFPKGITGVFEKVSDRSTNRRFSGKSFCNVEFKTPERCMKAFIDAKIFVSTSRRISPSEASMIFIGFGNKELLP